MELGTLGIWSMQLRGADRPAVRDAAAELDALGFTTLWIPGLDGQRRVRRYECVARRGAAQRGRSRCAWRVGQRPSDVGQRMATWTPPTVRAHCSGWASAAQSRPKPPANIGQSHRDDVEYLDRLAASDHPVTRDRVVGERSSIRCTSRRRAGRG